MQVRLNVIRVQVSGKTSLSADFRYVSCVQNIQERAQTGALRDTVEDRKPRCARCPNLYIEEERSWRNESNHRRAPGLNTEGFFDNRCIRISKSTVSNAAETSRSANRVTLPVSIAWWKSDRRRMRSVSVEWPDLKPDRKRGRRLFTLRYVNSRPATILSMIFDMNDMFDTGRKLAGSLTSMPGFFKRGVTSAIFCDIGTLPVVMDWLHISWRNGSTSLSISGGGLESDPIHKTSKVQTWSASPIQGLKESNLKSVVVNSGTKSDSVSPRTFLIFFSKNCWKSSGVNDGLGGADFRPSMVDRLFQRSLGLSDFCNMISSQYSLSFSLKNLCISHTFFIHFSLSSIEWDFLYILSSRLAWHLLIPHSASNHGAFAW